MAADFRFEPDLAAASTLPARWYLDPETMARERDRVFARTWQLVGHSDQVRIPGDFFTCTVAGEPLVVVRGDDGEVRALSAVCRHRAGPVAQGAGHRRSLQCSYHGWTYALDGRLLTTPEFDGVRDFDRGQVCLPRFRAEAWGPFLFACLDPAAPPLPEVLGSIPEETGGLPLGNMGLYKRVDYEVECNWKVYVDNYLEGYHIPMVHPGLFRELDYAAYRVETARWHSKQHAPIRARADAALYHRNLVAGAAPEALYYWLFPNVMLNLYPDNLQINVIIPLGVERTLTRFEWFVLDPRSPGVAEEFARSFAFSDEIQKEDIAICQAVQRNLRSRTYRRGRYSVQRENGVHHFHGLLARALAAGND